MLEAAFTFPRFIWRILRCDDEIRLEFRIGDDDRIGWAILGSGWVVRSVACVLCGVCMLAVYARGRFALQWCVSCLFPQKPQKGLVHLHSDTRWP
ncbi:hypothetical protein AVEN_211462-1 [Araneus ventricosus]|uniref:Uncharacterized protein n=1 Tax=Araneus ventricosus TaxID=182803 RepID=A0A4Y2LTN9_ARAVE|nr:hypothetical protein AVEN_211462-1 [Araneus ventricosus]